MVHLYAKVNSTFSAALTGMDSRSDLPSLFQAYLGESFLPLPLPCTLYVRGWALSADCT